MEAFAIITTVMTMLTPFFVKSGEKISEKVGEDLWLWIKKSFSKQGKELELPDSNDECFQKKLVTLLQDRIESDQKFKTELMNKLTKMQEIVDKNNKQNIRNMGNIEKQIIIQENHGNIQM